jgi:hypothetical protein
VALNLDTSAPIRSLARKRELVRAIYKAPASEQETDWLEWKSVVELTAKRWRAELSRQALGMANRDPEVAAKWAGGCGFVVLGVSPGLLDGTPVHDNADIEAWLTPYIGRAPNAPEWASEYVEVQGKQILIVTVEPPQPGQPAWPCRKTYTPDRNKGEDPKWAVRDGAVYVRHQASTEEASSDDIEMLSRRAAGSGRRLGGISLALARGCKAAAVDATEETIAAWEKREREALKPPPPLPSKPATTVPMDRLAGSSLEASVNALAQLAAQMKDLPLGAGLKPDTRTAQDYQAEVDGYIAKATKAMPGVLIRRTCERPLGRIALSVRNSTDDPIHKLRVELVIAAKGVMALLDDELPDAKLPKRPIMLRKAATSVFDAMRTNFYAPDYGRPLAIRSIGPRVEIDNSSSARLTFPTFDLYAQTSANLEEFYLLTNAAHAGKKLAADWSVRANNLSGVIRGTLEIEVGAYVPTIEELLAKADANVPPDDDAGDED